MPKAYLVSYATERFEAVREELNASAQRFGITNIISFFEKDLHGSDYYQQNKSILDEACGAGYWAWKPYFIFEALKRLQEGDILFYCDAGSMFVDSPAPLIDLCASFTRGVVLFDARPLTNRQFTKRDCFVRMNCDEPKYWNANKVIATILLLRKSTFAVDLIQEWLGYCHDRAALTNDPNICGRKNLSGYLQHRWDQAILSLLAMKYSIETFRNPTLWGNFLKLPQFRVSGEPVVSPYNLVPKIKTYTSRPQGNSPYGTIFVINRQPNMVGKPPLIQPFSFAFALRRAWSWAKRHSGWKRKFPVA